MKDCSITLHIAIKQQNVDILSETISKIITYKHELPRAYIHLMLLNLISCFYVSNIFHGQSENMFSF